METDPEQTARITHVQPRVIASKEQRLRAIKEIKNGKSRKDVQKELGVSLSTVNYWMMKANAKPRNLQTVPDALAIVLEEIRGLRADLRLLTTFVMKSTGNDDDK